MVGTEPQIGLGAWMSRIQTEDQLFLLLSPNVPIFHTCISDICPPHPGCPRFTHRVPKSPPHPHGPRLVPPHPSYTQGVLPSEFYFSDSVYSSLKWDGAMKL